ncbi:MAG TPA: cupin domain-containing protein [Chloroflexota bacterium]|nr:cupin domain-containing protein [Chloroflexota bacterium]
MFHSVRIDKSKAVRADSPLFEGVVYRQTLIEGSDAESAAVFFENGARTRPHTHSTDQVLTVVEGTCVVADATERKLLGVGEVALVKKGEWHWHGANKHTDACHITTRTPGPTSQDVEERDWANW